MSPDHRRDDCDDQDEADGGAPPLELDTVPPPPRPPGAVTVAVLKPRTLTRLVLLFAVAIILVAFTAYSAAWLGYQQSNRNTREQIAALNEDLAARRAARAQADKITAEQQARTVEAQERFRRYACALARAAASPDPEIRQMRIDLACDSPVPPSGWPSTPTSPGASPGPSPGARTPAGRGGGQPGAAPTGGRPPVGMPFPAPPPRTSTTPAPRPPSPSTPSTSTDDPIIGCADLPLLGRVCV